MSSTYLGQVATAVQRPCEALGRSPDLRAKILNQGTVRICCKDPRVGIGLGFIGPIYTAESLDTGSFSFGRRAEPSLHSATPPCNTCPVSAAISGNHNDNPPLHWTLSAVICWISHNALLCQVILPMFYGVPGYSRCVSHVQVTGSHPSFHHREECYSRGLSRYYLHMTSSVHRLIC